MIRGQTCVDKTNEELMRYVAFPNADPASCIVPKLCLLTAVMAHTGMGQIRNIASIGSCAGLIVSPQFWP
jgi:hypothetical protein